MARIDIRVKMESIYSYDTTPYCGYGIETRYIYKMIDEAGKIYVWKTTKLMGVEGKDEKGRYTFEDVRKGAEIRIKATVKGESDYNGEQQTEVNRVKLVEIIKNGKTWEEIEEEREAAIRAKQDEQLASLADGDVVWAMPYRQYKEHYVDCETLYKSYNDMERTITVIIREGRLKNSGVRGKHYSGYKLKAEDGKCITYRAICEENAIKRAVKEYGGEWECVKVYTYDREWW